MVSLAKNTIRSSLFLFGGRLIIKPIQFIRTIILARLLFPADFGLFGLAALVIGLADNLFQSGFNSAVIQKPKIDNGYLDVAWTANIIRNSLMAIGLAAIAPLAGQFFSEPLVVTLIRVLALAVFLNGFENTGVLLFQKELLFGRKFIYDLSLVISEVVVVISAALWFHNVWALVLGTVGNKLATIVFSFLLHPYRPKLSLNRDKVRELFHYGKWVSGLALVTLAVSRLDSLVIGRFLTPTDLGYYQIAFGLALLPATEIIKSFSSLLFPLFAKIQNDQVLLRRAFLMISRLTLALIVPATFGLWVMSSEAVQVLYGSKWLPLIPILSILVFYGLFKSTDYLSSSLFLGIGKPKISTSVIFVQAIVLAITMLPFVWWWGIIGAAWSMLVSGLAVALVVLWFIRHEVNLGVLGFFKMSAAPLAASLVMVVVLLEAKALLPLTGLVGLIAGISFGAVVYGASLFILDRLQGESLRLDFTWLKNNF